MRVYPFRLELSTPWTVSHGTSTSRTNVFLEIEGGIGEAPIVPYYEHDEAGVAEWLTHVAPSIPTDPSEPPERFLKRLQDGPAPAVSALDQALHDRWARNAGRPLYEMLGLSSDSLPDSSFTLGIPASDEAFLQALATVSAWPILKIKLGTGSADEDLHLVSLAREGFAGRLCVDANGGWDLSTATRMITALAELEVVFVEEPLTNPASDEWARLRARLPSNAPPIIVDESARSEQDVLELAPYVDGVNLKLAKSGGISGALRVIRVAQDHDLRVLIGCMVESSVGVTAAAHLAPLADYADLDGHLQIANDPFTGVGVERGVISLPQEPGLGLTVVDREQA